MATPGDPRPEAGPFGKLLGRIMVALRWWVIGFWALACMVSLFALPSLSESSSGSDLKGLLSSETPAVATELRSVEIFGFPLLGRSVVVQRNPDGLSVYAQARTVTQAVGVNGHEYLDLGPLRGAVPITNALRLFPSSSERGTTALTYLLFDPDVSFGRQTRAAQRYADRLFRTRDHVVGVTGSVPARAEQGRIISDHLPTVELLTLTAIVVIVGAAFRSVLAPVVAVLTTGVAYVMTLRLSGLATELFGVTSPSELEPVVVALLLGVVTDYVVFFLFSLRQELRTGAARLDAARAATARFGPIIGVAGLAVAAGTGALIVAQSAFFRALGPALVLTVLVALLVAVTLVPALMAVLGRFVFWPSSTLGSPDPGVGPARGMIRQVATRRRVAGVAAVGGTFVLATAAFGLGGLNLGVSFVGSLPQDTSVRRAAAAAEAGFAAGILSPTTVLVQADGLTARDRELVRFGDLLEDQPGVAGVLGPGDQPRKVERGVLTAGTGDAARYLVVLDSASLGAEAIDNVQRLDAELASLLARSGLSNASADLAGDTATASYIVDETEQDLLRIAIAALLANLLMLMIFLRAVVASVYLLATSMLSLAASLGLTTWVFEAVNPGAGLTFYVPFAAAVLLLAFGSDYNIFAVGVIWDEARHRPLSEAICVVMPGAIKAMLAAGLALAASFGLLAVVPLVPFRQLAFVMSVGIALDVLVVRALLMPALLTLVGRVSAWPSRRFRHT
ncbi:hypothetical protein BH18ACT8_BH18ACT8_09700 [soil metagenome]